MDTNCPQRWTISPRCMRCTARQTQDDADTEAVLSACRASKARTTPGPGELVGVEGALIEGLLGLVSGFAFGFVGTTLGHPADTIKTKMQADPQFSGRNALFVFRTIVKRDGFTSLYRGFLPPLMGGSCFMSAVFGTYSSTFAACENTIFMVPLGGTGFRPSIVVASTAAAASRSMIETPFELLKTRIQLDREWRVAGGASGAGNVGITSTHASTTRTFGSMSRHVSLSQLRECYKGFKVTLYRNVLLHGTMFTVLDYSTRAAPDLAGTPFLGAFFKGAVCNTLGWFVAWPMELLKSKIQVLSCKLR